MAISWDAISLVSTLFPQDKVPEAHVDKRTAMLYQLDQFLLKFSMHAVEKSDPFTLFVLFTSNDTMPMFPL